MTAHAPRLEPVPQPDVAMPSVDGGPTYSILESAQDAFVSIDAAGRVVVWDRAAEETFGWSRGEAAGALVAELIVPERFRDAHQRRLRRYLETGEERVSGQRLELVAMHRDGHELEIEMTISPVRVGEATVVSAFLRNITARREAEREVRRLAAIVETSEDAIISGSIDGTVATWNAGAERLYGYTAEEMIGQATTRLLPSGDSSEVQRVRERLSSGGRVRDFETREVHKDGHLVDVSVSMSPLTDESGHVVGVASIARDVSARKATEQALIEAWERFHGAFVNAPIGMALVGLDGTFLTANRAFCELVGRSEKEMNELGLQGVTHPDALEADLELVARVLDGEIERSELEKRYLRPDGSIVWGLLCVSLVRDSNGEPVHFIRQVQDITVRKEAEEELRRYSDHLNELALQDPLTGLRNYRDFHAALDRELERARRHGGEFSVVLLHVDGFAQINRAGGHVEGDRVLREVGRAVAGVCRASDLAARLGGDKLALVLPETGEQGAEELTERVRRAVAGVEKGLSLSHGIASWPAAGDSKEVLLRQADVALRIATPSRARRGDGRDGLSGEVRLRVERVLALAREQLRMDVAFLGELVDGGEIFRAVVGDGAAVGIEIGAELPLSQTLCDRMLSGRLPNVVADSATEPEIAGLAPVRNGGLGSYVGVPVHFPDGRLYGALCTLSAYPRPDLSEREVELMRFLAGIVGELLDQAGANAREHRAALELSGIRALVAALEARDHYTGEHSRTVVRLAAAVAERLGLSRGEVLEIEQVAMLHDIGKVGILDSVLQKRAGLAREEWELMLQHPAVGERIVGSIDSLSHLAPAVRAEHERFDGTGYPDGLEGEEIPIASRITFVCDAYHAMTSDRPYRAAMSPREARREVEANAGTQFDPVVVRALVAVLDEERCAGAKVPPRGDIPAAEPRTSTGSATVLGAARWRCRWCGTHVAATLTSTPIAGTRSPSLHGSCSNCGSSELEPVEA